MSLSQLMVQKRFVNLKSDLNVTRTQITLNVDVLNKQLGRPDRVVYGVVNGDVVLTSSENGFKICINSKKRVYFSLSTIKPVIGNYTFYKTEEENGIVYYFFKQQD